jgi:hypothetical protein
MPKNKNKNKNKNKKDPDADLKALVSSHHITGAADVHVVPADLRRRQRNWLIGNLKCPRNFLDQIHWVQSTIRDTVTSFGSSVIGENNQQFVANHNINDYSSYLSVFDQYCIYAAHVAVCQPNVVISSGSSSYGRIITAIDYDNVTALGSETQLLQYNSASVTEIRPGFSHERVVKPCADTTMYVSGSAGYAPARVWIDSASSNVPHYGIRVMTAGNTSSSNFTLDVIVTVLVGFRNNI